METPFGDGRVVMHIPITPVAKPRMTQRDRWAKRPGVVRYYEFCDELREHWGGQLVSPILELTFHIPMPQSWSKKKKSEMLGEPHQQRPDIDNLIKSFLDALCDDDSYIYSVKAEKRWDKVGSIVVH
jgi:Holliday junction resolvase RusA-like endonuclease